MPSAQRVSQPRHAPRIHHGITPATIDNALYDAFGQRIISTIFTQSNQYRVILEADPDLHRTLESLGTIYLPSSTATSGQVPLSAVARVEERSAPLLISHLGQFPAATVSFNLAAGAALGDAVTEDFSPTRINVRIGADGRVGSIDCG